MARIKWTIEKAKEEFGKEGYVLLEEEYINSNTKMRYKCPNGHEHSITMSKFKSGRRCPFCANEKMSKDRRKDIEVVRADFEKEGYTLLTKEYINSGQILETICPNGHIHKTTYCNFYRGQRCGKCYGKNIHYTYEQVKEIFEKEGYILLSKEYVNCKQKLQYECPNGHKHEITLDKFINKKDRCPFCANSYKGEEAIRLFLEKNNIEYKHQYFFKDCRDKLALRFDFYIPSYNLLVEYDGIGHFEPTNFNGIDNKRANEGFKKQQFHDQIKNEYCKSNNIPLLRISYKEINEIENILKQTLNL